MPGKENKQRAADSVSRFFLNLKHVCGCYLVFIYIIYSNALFIICESLKHKVYDFWWTIFMYQPFRSKR